jgi:hypothetical protein
MGRKAQMQILEAPYNNVDWSRTAEGHCGEKCLAAWRAHVAHIGAQVRTPVVISRAFFLFSPCNHIINIKKKIFFR